MSEQAFCQVKQDFGKKQESKNISAINKCMFFTQAITHAFRERPEEEASIWNKKDNADFLSKKKRNHKFSSWTAMKNGLNQGKTVTLQQSTLSVLCSVQVWADSQWEVFSWKHVIQAVSTLCSTYELKPMTNSSIMLNICVND